jgi:N6-L-threonylcarbamoyladenine synthase
MASPVGTLRRDQTSCDGTAAAVVTEDGRILANVVSSQAELHALRRRRPGGRIRRHLELVAPVVEEPLAEAGTPLDGIDAVAVTRGPGLIGALLVGISAAKAIAWSRRLPLIPVDHLHGHVASLFLRTRGAAPLPVGERRPHAASRRA